MSCGLALAVSLALTPAVEAPASAPAPSVAAAPASVAGEALFADIVQRAQRLEQAVAAFRSAGMKTSATAVALPGFDAFKAEAKALAELDMQGHRELAARSADGDLK